MDTYEQRGEVGWHDWIDSDGPEPLIEQISFWGRLQVILGNETNAARRTGGVWPKGAFEARRDRVLGCDPEKRPSRLQQFRKGMQWLLAG